MISEWVWLRPTVCAHPSLIGKARPLSGPAIANKCMVIIDLPTLRRMFRSRVNHGNGRGKQDRHSPVGWHELKRTGSRIGIKFVRWDGSCQDEDGILFTFSARWIERLLARSGRET